MLIWLVISGEPKPGDGASVRLLRMGMLAYHLAHSGHRVVWWSSDFDHSRKVHRFGRNTDLDIEPNLTLRLLHGCGYRGHVSLARLMDHRQVAAAFSLLAPAAPPPDIIVAAYPTIELCAACARYAKLRGIPFAIDIRDLWPDIFSDILPPPMRPLARMALMPYQRIARQALAAADALIGISEPILKWGLLKAGRDIRSADAVIPFGYAPCSNPSGIREAIAEWRRLGVDCERHFVICFFATFGRHLDIDTVIDAARTLEQRGNNDVRIVLCGQGDRLERFRARAKGISTILFPGWVNATQIGALMSISKLGLAPYWPRFDFAASIPNKPIEYLSAGLPILTCLKGLLADMVLERSLGYTYTAGDAQSLVDSILLAKSQPELLVTIGARCRQLFEKDYRADHVLATFQTTIEGLARHRDDQRSVSGGEQPLP